MLSWLTGSKLVDATADLEEEQGLVENTYIDAPETPAHIFPVRAFKYAIFGTPQPGANDQTERLLRARKDAEKHINVTPRKSEEKAKPVLATSEANSRLMSPTKPGILLTPGTTRGRRKDVTFCAEVVDNEGKTTGKTAASHTVPGKFPSPSPWTAKPAVAEKEKKTKTKLTAALYEAQATGSIPKDASKPRAKDDADLTVDIMEPRSESGKYWKEQYLAYSKKSEEETKKLIAKQRLAKEYARKKDDEAVEARQQLEMERRRRGKREKSLEKEVKELRELLRKAMGENGKTSTEVALLRQQVDRTDSGPNDSSKSTKETTGTTSTTVPDSIWEDAAEPDEEHARVIPFLDAPAFQTHERQAKAESNRNHRGERKLSRKRGRVSRLDSVLTIEASEVRVDVPDRIPSPTPERPSSARLQRRTLGERHPNMGTSSPGLNLHSPSDFKEKSKAKQDPTHKSQNGRPVDYKPFDAAVFLETFDASVDYSIIQDTNPMHRETASQPNERNGQPSKLRTSTRQNAHSGAEAEVSPAREGKVPSDREAIARARVAEKQAQRRKAKENARLS